MRWLVLSLLVAAGCAHHAPASDPAPTAANRSLFERLGGLPAITATVDAFLGKVAADDRLNWRFAGADLGDLKQKLIDQICQASGGPCIYKGKDMIAAHRGMNLQTADFDALVGDLQAALVSLGVPAKEQNDLLGSLAGLKPQIVDNGVAADH